MRTAVLEFLPLVSGVALGVAVAYGPGLLRLLPIRTTLAVLVGIGVTAAGLPPEWSAAPVDIAEIGLTDWMVGLLTGRTPLGLPSPLPRRGADGRG